jgi:hypothetical protein
VPLPLDSTYPRQCSYNVFVTKRAGVETLLINGGQTQRLRSTTLSVTRSCRARLVITNSFDSFVSVRSNTIPAE